VRKNEEEWDHTFRINIYSMFLLKAAVPHLKQGSAIVNTSTMAAGSVEYFGESTPLGRAGQPAELAPVHVLLACGDGSYISGVMIPVTGGRPIAIAERL
jgi:NAD(P)-dependent dehydrogenase (short-subunit alcohol dehydrogenase family)